VPQIINTNIMSLTAQYNLDTSQNALNMSMTRLSSGLRINSAADDPAGYAIAQQMTTQVNGMSQAGRNANNAVSLLQTGEGALTQVTDNLQNIRELAVEAADATNSATDRSALNQQVQQDLQQIDQIASTTQFNGQNILDGSFGQANFQVGANVGDTVGINLSTSVRTASIGQTADYVNSTTAYSSTSNLGQQGTGVSGAALTSGALTLAVGSGSATAVIASTAGSNYLTGGAGGGQTAQSAYAKAAAINASGVSGITATADTTAQIAWSNVTVAGYSLSINGIAIYTNATGAVTPITGSAAASAINAQTDATGVTATFNATSNDLTLEAADGSNIYTSQTVGATANQGLNGTGAGTNNTTNAALQYNTAANGTTTNTAVGTIRLTSSQTIQVGGAGATAIGYTQGSSLALSASALNTIDVSTVADANTTISRVDAALTSVNNLAAQFGALQNRFQSTISNLQTGVQNITAARSTIQDADFAAETANMTRAQILQQAGTAILAQANTDPENVLTLLKA
jgi:flagellin